MKQSVYIGDDMDMIADTLELHRIAKRGRVLDATYGYGGFWRGRQDDGLQITGLDKRSIEELVEADPSAFRRGPASQSRDPARVHLPPGVVEIVQGDYTCLPFDDGYFDAVVFDPPFLPHLSTGSLMETRYTTFDSYDELIVSLKRAAIEFTRVLRQRGGFVIAKCMDYTDGRRRRWLHMDLANSWAGLLRLDDLRVNVKLTNPRTTKWQRQQRSKSSHCFFMVFRPHGEAPVGSRAGTKRAAVRGDEWDELLHEVRDSRADDLLPSAAVREPVVPVPVLGVVR